MDGMTPGAGMVPPLGPKRFPVARLPIPIRRLLRGRFPMCPFAGLTTMERARPLPMETMPTVFSLESCFARRQVMAGLRDEAGAPRPGAGSNRSHPAAVRLGQPVTEPRAWATPTDRRGGKVGDAITRPGPAGMNFKPDTPFLWPEGDRGSMILMGQDKNRQTSFGLGQSKVGQRWTPPPESPPPAPLNP